MSTVSTIEVKGLKDQLRLLNKIAPGIRREITKKFKKLAEPGVKEAMALRKKGDPEVKGFQHHGRTGVWAWKPLIAKVDTRKARKRNVSRGASFESLGTVKITTRDAASSIMDMAGRVGHVQTSGQSKPYPGRPNGHKLNGQGGHMIGKLNRTYGRSGSRFMWPGAETGLDGTEDAFRDLVRDVSATLQRELGRDYFGMAEAYGVTF